jgi:thiol-disulfide isomerase/thioredoxin
LQRQTQPPLEKDNLMSSVAAGRFKWLAIAAVCAFVWHKGWFPVIIQTVKQPWFALSAAPISGPEVRSGAKMSLADYKGKVVLVNFWMPGNPDCVTQIGTLSQLYVQYQKKGFTVLGVAMDTNGAPTLSQTGAMYPNLVGDNDVLLSYIGTAPSLPSSALVDRRGRIIGTYRGLRTYKELDRDIQRVL